MARTSKVKRAPAKAAAEERGPSTRCTRALTLQFCEELRRSYHVTTAARKLGLSRDTVNDWLGKGEDLLRQIQAEDAEPCELTANQEAYLEFAVRVAQVRSEVEQELLGYVRMAAEPAPFDFDPKGRPFRVLRIPGAGEDQLTGDWRAAEKLLEIMRPDVYGGRQTITHEGGEKPVQVQSVNVQAVVLDEQASELACALLDRIGYVADDAGGTGSPPRDVPVRGGTAPEPAEPTPAGPDGGAADAADGDDAASPREE